MNRQEQIAAILDQWKDISQIRIELEEPIEEVLAQEEDQHEMILEHERQRMAEEILLRENNVGFQTVFLAEESDPEFPENLDPMLDEQATNERRKNAYVDLCIQLVDLDATETALELLRTLTNKVEGEIELDTYMISEVAVSVAAILSERHCVAIAWRFADELFSIDSQDTSAALKILSTTKQLADLTRAQKLVERAEKLFWNHPAFGTRLRTNAVRAWMDLWEVSRRSSDLEYARGLCHRLNQAERAQGYAAIASCTRDSEDVLSAFRAAEAIRNDSLRAETANQIILRLASSILGQQDSPDTLEMLRRIAGQLKNQHWGSLLIERMEIFRSASPDRTSA